MTGLRRCLSILIVLSIGLFAFTQTNATQQPNPADKYKEQVSNDVEALRKQTQVMIDQVYSYAELGFQEYETSKYLTGVLEKEGFKIERGISGIPTAWMATWGSGKPVIALGSDIDCIPQASQKPGVAYHDPIIEGAPGHGEGHNSGLPLNITAALAVKKLMEKEHLSGTLKIWPGVAEELLGSKEYYVRDGVFKDVDIVLFSHVASNMGVSWGDAAATGLVSVAYDFKGEAAHAAGAPWRGKSALDAVELMDVGWSYKRELLRPQQRSHRVIPDGGDQPNVVPSHASVWYYFREADYAHIQQMWEDGNTMAQGAAMMTGTTVKYRILGAAWPQHFNKVVAETMYKNIQKVGIPQWSEADQTLAKALQKEIGVPERGLATNIGPLGQPAREEQKTGGSDDIGDVSWAVPTVTLRYPSNIPNLPGHNWTDGIAMATPIAHKGATAGAKVMAMTLVDLLIKPELVKQAWEYYREVQTKDVKYKPFIAPTDKPSTFLNEKTMATYREQMKKYYFDSTKYDNYLEQLGIKYPTVRKPDSK